MIEQFYVGVLRVGRRLVSRLSSVYDRSVFLYGTPRGPRRETRLKDGSLPDRNLKENSRLETRVGGRRKEILEENAKQNSMRREAEAKSEDLFSKKGRERPHRVREKRKEDAGERTIKQDHTKTPLDLSRYV